MEAVKFIHCADLHLGSPFKGISSGNAALGSALAAATFDAFRNIIDLALERKIDFLLIAGDVFDSEDRSLHSRLFFKKQLERLETENIKCFIVCGNHDPLLSWSQAVELPGNTLIFAAGKAQTFIVERAGRDLAAICGTSFGSSKVKTNLARKFKRERSDIPAIALLHANIECGSHANYAPAKLSDLEKSGFDYWALGHVHSFAVLNKACPAVVYPGCPQGTSPRETGEKTCCFVQLQNHSDPRIEAVVVDEIRYAFKEVNISGIDTFEDLFATVNECCDKIIRENGKRKTVLRLKLSGRGKLNKELRDEAENDELAERFESETDAFGDQLFLNRVELSTRDDYAMENLNQDSGFIADLLACSDEMLENPEEMEKLEAEMKLIYKKCRAMPRFSDDELREIIEDAKHLVLDKLLGEYGK